MVHPNTEEPPPLPDDAYPFNPYNPGTPEAQVWDQRNMPQQPQVQEQAFTAEPQGTVQPQGNTEAQHFEAQPMGSPVTETKPTEPEKSYVPVTWDQTEIQRTHQHKARLGIKDDSQLTHYIRDFLKNDKATMTDLKPSDLKAFNDHLEKFSA